jgi:Tol biopolymer transport system component
MFVVVRYGILVLVVGVAGLAIASNASVGGASMARPADLDSALVPRTVVLRDRGPQGSAPSAEGIVFVRGGDLYAIAIDGTREVRLTSTSVEEDDPAVSPDGRRIAYGRRFEVWLTNADGTGQKRLLPAGRGRYAFTGDPAWSPGGRTIFVARQRQTPNEICGSIFRIGANGRGLKRVTGGLVIGSLQREPAVSADGRRIAFSSGECQPGLACCALVVVDAAGRRTRDLRKLPALDAQFAPSWAPDGRRIAFAVVDFYEGSSVVYVVNRDGSGLRRVTDESLVAVSPAWSPDGRWIAFAGGPDNDLYITQPDGTGLRLLTRTPSVEHSPAWISRLPDASAP